jgi:hypothetical protein
MAGRAPPPRKECPTMTRILRDPDYVVEEEHRETAFGFARAWTRFLALWVSLAAVVIEVALAFRLGFLAGEANARNNFVDFIYDVTGPLVQPFEGIIANRTLDSGGIFEPASAFAMGIYLIAALLVVIALWAAAAAPLPDDDDVVVRERRRIIHEP